MWFNDAINFVRYFISGIFYFANSGLLRNLLILWQNPAWFCYQIKILKIFEVKSSKGWIIYRISNKNVDIS